MRVVDERVIHPDRSFRYLRFETEAFVGGPHRHRHLELTWIEAGAGLRVVGDRVEPFEAGELVLVGSGTPHGWVSSRSAQPSSATVLQFAPELCTDRGFPELARLAPLAARAALGLLIDGPCRRRVTDLLVAMRTAEPIGRLAGLVAILGELLTDERSLAPIASSPLRARGGTAAPDNGERPIDRVIAWIHRGLGRELTVAEAARIAGVTAGAFSRYFRHALGKTFTGYLNDLRCSEACLRLRRSQRPVAAIAHDCGFATLSHFNRQFRLRVGVTPRQYRRGEGRLPPAGVRVASAASSREA